jgi:hypothetical protein
VRSPPHRRGSHVGAVDEGVGGLTDLIEPAFGEEVDGALALEESVLGRSSSGSSPALGLGEGVGVGRR